MCVDTEKPIWRHTKKAAVCQPSREPSREANLPKPWFQTLASRAVKKINYRCLKDSDTRRHWGQEEKGTTEDEMAGWHHRLDGREFE